MKKAWSIALGTATLLAVCVCWGGASLAQSSEEPVLTQQIKCIILAKTNRELVVQSVERAELRTVRLAKSENSNGDAAVQIGDLVQLETVLHSDNTETLRTVQVLRTGEVTQQEAAALLEGKPEALAFAAVSGAQTAASDSATADLEKSSSTASEQQLQSAAGTQNATS